MTLETVEIKAFVPARDFALSKRFYEDLGFALSWSDDDLAYMHAGDCSFLLQNFYQQELAENFMMHMLVKNVDDWWQLVQDRDLIGRYNIRTVPPQDQPWGIRDFVIIDPTGVLWRIGQNLDL